MEQLDDKLFNELRQGAIDVWSKFDDTYGYATDKIETVTKITNYRDNYGMLIGMMDVSNQRKLYNRVSPEAQALIDEWVGGLSRVERVGVVTMSNIYDDLGDAVDNGELSYWEAKQIWEEMHEEPVGGWDD